jgi:hypothetical protein
LKATEKWEVEVKGKGEIMKGFEQTKINYTSIGHILRLSFDHQLKY